MTGMYSILKGGRSKLVAVGAAGAVPLQGKKALCLEGNNTSRHKMVS